MLSINGEYAPHLPFAFPYHPATFHSCRRHYSKSKVCYSWNCKRLQCRQAKLWVETERIRLGVQHMLKRDDRVWFFTVSPLDPNEATYTVAAIKDFKDRVGKLLETLRQWAYRSGHDLLRVRVFGLKGLDASMPYQLHSHVIASWTPDPEHVRNAVYTSAKLNEEAKALGLKIHLEQAQYPEAVARYTANNARELDDVELPYGFHRVSYSRSWPDLDWQQKRRAIRDEKRLRQLKQQLDKMGCTLDELISACALAVILG